MVNSRIVHLDFHTSEYIENIGAEFDKAAFQKTLKDAHVTQITLFAKCHHGWCYYPTKVGKMHPHLKYDLLGAQIDACKEIGIKTVVYITAGWSANDAVEHPEWQVVFFDTGERVYMENAAPTKRRVDALPTDPKPTCAWDLLCLAGGYKQHILDITAEVCQMYPKLDGLFYDICCLETPCVCDSCKKDMQEKGYDITDRNAVSQYMVEEKVRFMADCKAVMEKTHPNGSIFFNGGAEISRPFYCEKQTHYELEDLPTTGGYDNIYNRAKCFSKKGKDVVGMTGKFRHSWGEFGSYKKAEALKYECAAMLALGMKCNVGDQLHPNGKLDPYTYKVIGEAFGYVEEIEQYCYGCQSTARLGVVLSKNYEANEGIATMLVENQLDYEVAEESDDLSALYDCIILTDDAVLTDTFAQKLTEFTQKGGALVTIGKAGLKDGKFVVPTGVEYIRAPKYDMDYIVTEDVVRPFGLLSPLLAYKSAHATKVTADGEVLAGVQSPYFSRTIVKYCSHRNTPNNPQLEAYPAIVRTGNLLYFAHDFGTVYRESGDTFMRETFIKALRTVYTPVVEIDGLMSVGRSRLVTRDNSAFLHLLYASPVRRGNVILLEDFPTLQNIKVFIRGMQAAEIRLRPNGETVAFENTEDGVSFTVPQMRCHALLEIIKAE